MNPFATCPLTRTAGTDMTARSESEIFWEDRYRDASPETSGRPSAVLVRYAEARTPGRALELGVGGAVEVEPGATQGRRTSSIVAGYQGDRRGGQRDPAVRAAVGLVEEGVAEGIRTAGRTGGVTAAGVGIDALGSRLLSPSNPSCEHDNRNRNKRITPH